MGQARDGWAGQQVVPPRLPPLPSSSSPLLNPASGHGRILEPRASLGPRGRHSPSSHPFTPLTPCKPLSPYPPLPPPPGARKSLCMTHPVFSTSKLISHLPNRIHPPNSATQPDQADVPCSLPLLLRPLHIPPQSSPSTHTGRGGGGGTGSGPGERSEDRGREGDEEEGGSGWGEGGGCVAAWGGGGGSGEVREEGVQDDVVSYHQQLSPQTCALQPQPVCPIHPPTWQ